MLYNPSQLTSLHPLTHPPFPLRKQHSTLHNSYALGTPETYPALPTKPLETLYF